MPASALPVRRSGTPQIVLLWLMALPLLVVLGMGIGLIAGVRGPEIPMLGISLVTIAIAFIPLILDVSRPAPRRHIMLSITSLSWIIYFAVPVFTAYFFEATVLQREEYGPLDLKGIGAHYVVGGQIASLVALVVMLAGYLVPVGRLIPGGVPRPRRDWSYSSTVIVAALMLPLGWALFLGAQFGILPTRIGSGMIGWISTSTYFGIALLMLAYLRYRSRPLLQAMLILIPLTMSFNFFTGAKGLFFAPAVMVAIAYIVVNRRIRVWWILAAFLAVSIVYPLAEFHRRVILKNYTLGAVYALSRPIETISRLSEFATSLGPGDYLTMGISATSSRFDSLGILSAIVRDCPRRVPFQGGWSLAHIPLGYVPRIVWPAKPQNPTGQWVSDNFAFAGHKGMRSATGPSWVGELYFNFGWPGIVIGMLLMGVFLRIVHEVLFPPDAVLPAQLMGVVVLFGIPSSLGGALVGPVNITIMGALPVVVAHWGVRLLAAPPRREALEHGRTDAELGAGARAN